MRHLGGGRRVRAGALARLGEEAEFGRLSTQGAIERAVLDLLDDAPTPETGVAAASRLGAFTRCCSDRSGVM